MVGDRDKQILSFTITCLEPNEELYSTDISGSFEIGCLEDWDLVQGKIFPIPSLHPRLFLSLACSWTRGTFRTIVFLHSVAEAFTSSMLFPTLRFPKDQHPCCSRATLFPSFPPYSSPSSRGFGSDCCLFLLESFNHVEFHFNFEMRYIPCIDSLSPKKKQTPFWVVDGYGFLNDVPEPLIPKYNRYAQPSPPPQPSTKEQHLLSGCFHRRLHFEN